MKYLVTGGAGFIGNALAFKLASEGHEVVIIDNVNTYYDIELKEARLARLPNTVVMERVDLTDTAALARVFAQHKFDAVAHLAAQAGVRYSLECPEAYVQSNYVGTFNLLEAMRQAGVTKLIYASTSSVYGEDADVPFAETKPADRPVSVYAATKRAGELLLHSYHHLHGFDVACLRFFTVYGPWGRPDMAPYLFTDKILRGEELTVFNKGDMRRDFTYIDDIVEGFVAALRSSHGYEVYNLGAGTPIGLLDFIAAVEQATGQTAKLAYAPMQPGDVSQTYADITKAAARLQYRPQVALAEGMAAYVDWFREFYQR